MQAYLRDQVTPEPVTAAMVQRYYEAHPERFGGEPLYTLQWLRAPAGQDEAQRQALLKAVPQLRASDELIEGYRRQGKRFEVEFVGAPQSQAQAFANDLAALLEACGVQRLQGRLVDWSGD